MVKLLNDEHHIYIPRLVVICLSN